MSDQVKTEVDSLAHSLAYEMAESIIDCESLYVEGPEEEGEGWRLVDPEGEVELVDAMRYLELRGLLDRHPDHENWVRVCDESEASA